MSQPSIKKNFFYTLAYQVLTLITPLITAPYVSRVLGADGVGIYSYTASIMAYFTMFAALGTAQYGSREIARLRDDIYLMSKAFYEIAIIVFFTTTICTVGWIILIFESDFYKYYFIALIPTLLATAFDISWFYTGIEKMGYIVARNTICRIVGIIVLFLFVQKKEDLFLYMLLNSVIQLLGNISMWSYIKDLIVKVPFKTLSFTHHIKETLTYFIITIAISLYTVLDKVLIGYITGDNYQNGYYEQANKIIGMAKTISFAAINTIMGARLSYLFEKKAYDEICNRIRNSVDFILFMSFGFIFGILAVANNFVPFFFGDGYESVIPLLCLMTPLLFFIALSTCLGSHYYLPSGQIKLSTKMTIQGSIINLCFNLILIPKFGATGAVIGTLIGEGFIAAIYCIRGREYLPISLIFNKSYKRIIAGCLMLISSYIIDYYSDFNKNITLFIQVVGVSCIYFLVLYILKDSFISYGYKIIESKIKKYGQN